MWAGFVICVGVEGQHSNFKGFKCGVTGGKRRSHIHKNPINSEGFIKWIQSGSSRHSWIEKPLFLSADLFIQKLN